MLEKHQTPSKPAKLNVGKQKKSIKLTKTGSRAQ
jgi:hypothetical protein